MRNYIHLFLIFIIILASCDTLDKIAIQNLQKTNFDSLKLDPGYDIYELRIDLIRQEKDVTSDSGNRKESVPYSNIGFYLGNGLFFDVNDNLSFVIPALFNLSENKNFEIEQENDRTFFKSKRSFERKKDEFTESSKGFFSLNSTQNIDFSDSVISVKGPLLSSYKIFRTDTSVTAKYFLSNISICKKSDGYFVKHLFGKDNYEMNGDTLNFDNIYFIINSGDKIEIYVRGLFHKRILLYTIVQSKNEIYCYNKYYTGIRIIKDGNRLAVFSNKNKICTYTLK